MKTLGYLIRDRRKELGLTQGDLADDVGITQSYLAKIETDFQSPGTKTLIEIADILEIPIGTLMVYDMKTAPIVKALQEAKEYDSKFNKFKPEVKKLLLEIAPIVEKYL